MQVQVANDSAQNLNTMADIARITIVNRFIVLVVSICSQILYSFIIKEWLYLIKNGVSKLSIILVVHSPWLIWNKVLIIFVADLTEKPSKKHSTESRKSNTNRYINNNLSRVLLKDTSHTNENKQ